MYGIGRGRRKLKAEQKRAPIDTEPIPVVRPPIIRAVAVAL